MCGVRVGVCVRLCACGCIEVVGARVTRCVVECVVYAWVYVWVRGVLKGLCACG